MRFLYLALHPVHPGRTIGENKTRSTTDRVHQWLIAAQVTILGPRFVAFRYAIAL